MHGTTPGEIRQTALSFLSKYLQDKVIVDLTLDANTIVSLMRSNVSGIAGL